MNFVQIRPADTAIAVLEDIESALQIAQHVLSLQPKPKGGRKLLRWRLVLIMNVAQFCSEIGKDVSAGRASKFAALCYAICEAIGWPTDGLDSAIPDAVREWRNLLKKSSG